MSLVVQAEAFGKKTSCQTTSSKHFNLKNLGFHINGGSEGLSSEAVVSFKSQIVKYEN